jgi:hypothetical protein
MKREKKKHDGNPEAIQPVSSHMNTSQLIFYPKSFSAFSQ